MTVNVAAEAAVATGSTHNMGLVLTAIPAGSIHRQSVRPAVTSCCAPF